MKSWGWVAIGLAVGVGVGLLFGWAIWPVQYYDTAPADLHDDYKEDYIRLIASTYAVDKDLEAAKTRLAYLNSDALTVQLVDLAEHLISQQGPAVTITALVNLSRDLGCDTPAMDPYLRGDLP